MYSLIQKHVQVPQLVDIITSYYNPNHFIIEEIKLINNYCDTKTKGSLRVGKRFSHIHSSHEYSLIFISDLLKSFIMRSIR